MVLVSCMANPNIMDLSDAEHRRVSKIKLYEADSSPPESTYRVVKRIKGLSCWRHTLHPKIVTDKEAFDGLIIQAAQLDADAVVNIKCEHRAETDWKHNCWESVACAGDAVVFTDLDAVKTNGALNLKATRYFMNLPENPNHPGSGLIITYGNEYPEDTYDFLGLVKIIDCQEMDYSSVTMGYLPPFFIPIPMPPPDADSFMGLPSHEDMKKKSAIESLRISAREAGADAVVNLICQPSTGPTLKSGCKSYIQCIGDMISFK
jgi:uncharacterized protein YbjQ (UPF0145 family)